MDALKTLVVDYQQAVKQTVDTIQLDGCPRSGWVAALRPDANGISAARRT
jgi:hypothetical protein